MNFGLDPETLRSLRALPGPAVAFIGRARQWRDAQSPSDSTPPQPTQSSIKPAISEDPPSAPPMGWPESILMNHRLWSRDPQITLRMAAPIPFIPRGLVNRGNTCFANVVYQSLLACPPFHRMLRLCDALAGRGPKTMSKEDAARSADRFPLFLRFVRLCRQLTPVSGESSGSRRLIAHDDQPTRREARAMRRKRTEDARRAIAALALHGPGTPAHPSMFDDLPPPFGLGGASGLPAPALSTRGVRRQQDAQEFLHYLLETLHEEMLRADSRKREDAGGTEWQEVAAKGPVTLREAHTRISPIHSLFGGQLRSLVRRTGAKNSASLEPFYTLPLDIRPRRVVHVEDSIDLFVERESVEGIKADRDGSSVEASRQLTLEHVPTVLVLHLKRFAYSVREQKSTKVGKFVSYRHELMLQPHWLSADRVAPTERERMFRLFAVVAHYGDSALGGHYVADVRQADGRWMSCDDGLVSEISPDTVLKRSAYMLWYLQEQPEAPPVSDDSDSDGKS